LKDKELYKYTFSGFNPHIIVMLIIPFSIVVLMLVVDMTVTVLASS